MNNNLVKTIIYGAGALLVLFIAWKLLKFAIYTLLPLAVIIIAAYIVYKFVAKK